MTATLDPAAGAPGARAERFLQKPWAEKRASIYFRLLRAFPGLSIPMQLTSGAWWLVRNDMCSAAILSGRFENDEHRFVAAYLRPGMTVLDIGAHHGYYTLLASNKVGCNGRVIAFEPSNREYKSLVRNVRLNRCQNVVAEKLALGSKKGSAELFVVTEGETGCNSLRPPDVSQTTRIQKVAVESLDQYLDSKSVERVDFVKLDAEGGELEILRGADRLLSRTLRPVILAEVQDLRTRPWGYEAREIIAFLTQRGFHWLRILPKGSLESLSADLQTYDGNFVAIPEERCKEFGQPELRN